MPGWNLGNQLEANSGGTPGETVWGNPVITEKLIKQVKAQGFKSIRIPVSYLSKIGAGPNYTIDSKWLDRVQEVVDMCIDNGLYAIINVHGDGYYTVKGGWLLCGESASEQKKIKAKYEKVWEQIAKRFKNYDEHLVFESMNEEFDNTYNTPNREYYDNINAYNQIFVDTVRKSGGKNNVRYLLIPGWNTDINYTAGDYGFLDYFGLCYCTLCAVENTEAVFTVITVVPVNSNYIPLMSGIIHILCKISTICCIALILVRFVY